jgi:hypothetical protein
MQHDTNHGGGVLRKPHEPPLAERAHEQDAEAELVGISRR